jgi:hypothetical protein
MPFVSPAFMVIFFDRSCTTDQCPDQGEAWSRRTYADVFIQPAMPFFRLLVLDGIETSCSIDFYSIRQMEDIPRKMGFQQGILFNQSSDVLSGIRFSFRMKIVEVINK